MIWSDYWKALGTRQRTGLVAGFALIVFGTTALAIWLLRDPYVPLASGLDGDRLDGVVQALERAKLDYQVQDSGDAIRVPRSQLGRAHVAMAGGAEGAQQTVGLELFKETDFSSTDFAQRINYQRALQGELTRTIQAIAGVRNAHVHVILPEAGLFKRDAAKATAAVSVTMQPGKLLTPAQVKGIQRLVANSVPEIRIDDVAVLDEQGTSLTRAGSEGGGELSSAQLDLKRQVDDYFEAKVMRLLRELVPDAVTSLSVDATLDERQLRVTTEEPLAARDSRRDGDHPAGVLVRERQSQHGPAAGLLQTDGYAGGGDGDSTDWEHEYKVGNRVEQTLSEPGSIKRISAAVAIRGAPAGLAAAEVERLVAHAVGADEGRGDSVEVVLLPAVEGEHDGVPGESLPATATAPPRRQATPSSGLESPPPTRWLIVAGAGLLMVALGAWLWLRKSRPALALSDRVDEEAVLAKVRQWLAEGAKHGGT